MSDAEESVHAARSGSEDEGEGGDAMSELRRRHAREAKELQAEVQRLKKAVPKGDNKRKKGVTVRHVLRDGGRG